MPVGLARLKSCDEMLFLRPWPQLEVERGRLRRVGFCGFQNRGCEREPPVLGERERERVSLWTRVFRWMYAALESCKRVDVSELRLAGVSAVSRGSFVGGWAFGKAFALSWSLEHSSKGGFSKIGVLFSKFEGLFGVVSKPRKRRCLASSCA